MELLKLKSVRRIKHNGSEFQRAGVPFSNS